MILGEDTTLPIATTDIETINLNNIATASDANNGITHTPGVLYDRNTPNPIFTPIDPTAETHINDESYDENEDKDDDDEDINDDNDKVESFKLLDKDTPEPITIEGEDKYSEEK